MLELFESRDRRVRDAQEIGHLFAVYGENTIAILKQRTDDRSISTKDRRHWKRILRKARRKEKNPN